MAIDFPNAPATNATYTVGNKTWIYDGATWNTYNTTSFSAETLPGTTLKSTVTGSSLTSLGTLTSLTIDGPGSSSFTLGDTGFTGYSGVVGDKGYLLVGNSVSDPSIYLRTVGGGGPVYIGQANSNTLQVGNGTVTVAGTMNATTFSGSGSSLTSLPADQLTGTVASARITGIGTLTTNVFINNGSPTIYLQDTDNRSSMIHCNSNIFYVLRGSGNNSTTWATVGGYWPLEINLENNNATFGGTLFAPGTVTGARFITNNASPSLELGDWSGDGTFSAVEGYNGYLLLGHTSNRACYLRTNNASAVNIGANGSDTLVVNNGNIVVNGTTSNDTLNVIGGSAWFSAMPAGAGSTVVNNFGFLRYVTSRRELKDNIVNVELSDGLNRILALRPVEFTMKPEYLADANEFTPFDVKRGFIAQETADVDHGYGQWGWVDENQMMATTPALNGELPLEEATPIYWNHDAVIADLVASIQNISARLQQLEESNV